MLQIPKRRRHEKNIPPAHKAADIKTCKNRIAPAVTLRPDAARTDPVIHGLPSHAQHPSRVAKGIARNSFGALGLDSPAIGKRETLVDALPLPLAGPPENLHHVINTFPLLRAELKQRCEAIR